MRLRERGHVPVVAPLFRIEHLPARIDADVQAILVTSRNGAMALAAADPGRSIPVFAVGEETAAALREAGFADVRSANGNAEALAGLVAASLDPLAGPVLHARGEDVRQSPLPALEAKGFATGEAILYRTMDVETLPPVAASCDTALVYSQLSAARLSRAWGARETALDIVAISRKALAPLRGAVFARTLRPASHPSEEAMLDLLDSLPKNPVAAARIRR